MIIIADKINYDDHDHPATMIANALHSANYLLQRVASNDLIREDEINSVLCDLDMAISLLPREED